jgi:hypothetical protein
MSFVKELRKALIENNSLAKAENPQAYAKLAREGLLLGHPVKIKGHEKRTDNGIPYHTSIKFFNKESDKPEHAHEAASKLHMEVPNPKEVGIEPTKIKSREGDDIYAIKLHGPHADKLKEHHKKFSHLGHNENYDYHPHISVSKETHDEIKAKGHKTAHDAGIEFGPAELKRGPKTLETYHPKMKKSEESGQESGQESGHMSRLKHPSNLNLDKGNKDISEKSLSDIQRDTAWTWASRAAACYEKLAKTGDWKWKTDAEEYRHEAVEHAALIGDTHPHVLEEIHKALEKYRNVSEKEAMDKAEECEAPPLTKPYSSEAQRRWAHTAAGKKALGGEAGVHEWDEATKGKKLPEKVGKSESLEKGAVKNALTAGMMAGALASAAPSEAKAPAHGGLHPTVSASPNTGYSREKMLNAISQVESSGGKNVHHKPTSMGTAWGRFAEMPDVIHDTIRLNPDLKRKHGKALRLQGENLNRYMQDNKGLEDLIAQKHLERLEHHFGHNPEAIARAWNTGITSTNRAINHKENIELHPYVKKFKQYYKDTK